MNYDQAIEYIHGTSKFGVKLGLENVKTLLDLMGNPHKNLRYVHVAGTNGKGSTVAFIGSILVESGYRVGIYTSPFIQRFTERIRINNDEISKEDLARIASFVREKVEIMVSKGFNHPTEFEIVTAIAFQYFFEQDCDIVVLEVGLGGRFDSTNVIDDPLVSVITTISYDHMDILGDTLSKIAFEKAGIIKDGTNVVLYPQADEAERVFEEVCKEKKAKLNKISFDVAKILGFSIDGQEFNYKEMKSLRISLLGKHQIKNAVTAIEAVSVLREKGYNITEDSIRKGLLKAKWPGRLEVLCRKPVFIIDGAHNLEGARALTGFLKEYFPQNKIVFIMGILKDKEYLSIIEEVVPYAKYIITVTPQNKRALPAKELSEIIKRYCNNIVTSDTIEGAVKKSLELTPEDGLICAFGSLYYIGEVRSMFSLS
ncbi:MAG TPA: folylpolyglutamate synthase/dihydrofolate synthase family protein [Acetivibrio sp.]|nr:bifunctional folylpolyglutamate synthase/dihydrofolate synthase [Clostridium sp.]HOQ36754.1 folylpolyglutamate synthase/dihydrofolate synthase family protein [Acetivibrio sp.]HPT91936.1 folylpolyglutamate synthase/dihydrofolate synthase family protein [Acetivibrio sp.]HQA56766.1 folylpolyglutamate synthase/dihydrofolate synthase family protein [Acetivibrio sp.]